MLTCLLVANCDHLLEFDTKVHHRCRYAPRMTASSFRYFIRGQSAKAAASDFVVAARRKVGLTFTKPLKSLKASS